MVLAKQMAWIRNEYFYGDIQHPTVSDKAGKEYKEMSPESAKGFFDLINPTASS